MPPEECGICGATVALGDAAHVMLNAKSEEGVRDYYVCPTCYEEDLVPHFPEPTTDDDDSDDEVPEADDEDQTGGGTENDRTDAERTTDDESDEPSEERETVQ